MESRENAVNELALSCRLCPRECGVNRLEGEIGICKTGSNPVYSSANLHYGEEPPISGDLGSGTIFLTSCNLSCMFCQNFPISQLQNGNELSIEQLAMKILDLEAKGAHNINFVTPTHQAHLIFKALSFATKKGLSIPIVYNSGGYESIEMIKLWDGIIDIYLPDSKYSDDKNSLDISNAPEYRKHNQIALKEMHKQVGDLKVDNFGIAKSGLIIRHLVLPGDLAGTEKVMRFIAKEISKNTHISLMSQYFPAWKSLSHGVLGRTLKIEEYEHACEALKRYELNNGWWQLQ